MLLSNDSKIKLVTGDLTAGLVVALVALPLCLGVALASNAPLFSGVLAGIIGGILVGLLSGSSSSVSGPAAGLTAVVAAQILSLGSFEAFLLALMFAGVIQIAVGIARGGFIAAYIPTSVIKGLLTAIGVILILKQIPHVVGYDADPEGDMSFVQKDEHNTFTELYYMLGYLHGGAMIIGVASILLLVVWDRIKWLKKSPIPSPLVVVLMGIGLSQLFKGIGNHLGLEKDQLVQVPVAKDMSDFLGFLMHPDFSQWLNPAIYMAAVTLAAVASLETLLNLEAVDKLDPHRRVSPPSRELIAQGIGNCVAGLIGGLPVTSVIVRSSVNINSGGRTKIATVFHGTLLLLSVAFMANGLNAIPLSCLAAILLVTGLKLASPKLIRQMWSEGRAQFLPFASTVIAIVVTDLLIGVLIGLAISVAFILRSNVRRSLRQIVEKHIGGDVVRIELPNQVSFLNRAALIRALDSIPDGGHLLLDAEHTDYIDPDILDLIRDFRELTGPARGVKVSMQGFRGEYQLGNRIQYVDYSTRDVQSEITPAQVLQFLKEGNERFRTGQPLTRDLGRLVFATSTGQHPFAVVLSCIDSRSPAELIFDLGVGDIFSVRLAGNVTSRKSIGSIEYACAVAGAKLIVVLGHTRCGAVTAAVDLIAANKTAAETTGCSHLDQIVEDVQLCVEDRAGMATSWATPAEKEEFVNSIARKNVVRVVETITSESEILDRMVREGKIAIAGAMYNVSTGELEFLMGKSIAVNDPPPRQMSATLRPDEVSAPSHS